MILFFIYVTYFVNPKNPLKIFYFFAMVYSTYSKLTAHGSLPKRSERKKNTLHLFLVKCFYNARVFDT